MTPNSAAPEDAKTKPSSSSASAEKAIQSLSQFVARVLDQLSLSAWLPSAALVLGIALIFSVAASLEEFRTKKKAHSTLSILSTSLDQLTQMSLGGALLVLAAIIVLTMLTQAFAFEAIRVLEGYWGTADWVERTAGWRCNVAVQVGDTPV